MEDRWDPNAEIICPYDETHVISVKRFQRHLVKCRQNHPEKDFVTCPFNARHMFLRSDLRKHLSHCADRVTLDPDVLQEEDPETGEILRLKGKTDMPKAPENIHHSAENWDDEIEENIAMKYAYQEEYLKLQGILNEPVEEEPILRRPTLPIVNKPNLPLINKPVNITGHGPLTSLRRPNVSSDKNAFEDTPSSKPITPQKTNNTNSHLGHSDVGEHRSDNTRINRVTTNDPDCSTITPVTTVNTEQTMKRNVDYDCSATKKDDLKNVLSENDMNMHVSKQEYDYNLDARIKSSNYNPLKTNRSKQSGYDGDSDTESMTSETSWTSSVYKPLKPYSNRLFIPPNPGGCHEDTLASPNRTLSSLTLHDTCSGTDTKPTGTLESKGVKSNIGAGNLKGNIARGALHPSIQGSAFTPVVPKNKVGVSGISAKPMIGRGLMNAHAIQINSAIESRKGIGRGGLKLAAMNFQAS